MIPILQKRGLFRTEYEGATLREHFGLPRSRAVTAPHSATARGPENRYRQPANIRTHMAPRIVVVPPSHAETAEIASKMAPAGFEIVMSSASPPN